MCKHFVLSLFIYSILGCSFKASPLHFDDMKLRPEKVIIESRIQLGDLYYVESVMNEVFEYGVEIETYPAPTPVPQQYINERNQLSKILKKQTFGAGSDPYYRVTSSVDFERRGCEATSTPLVIEADTSPTRAVEIAKACDDSINDPVLFTKVIRKIIPEANPRWNHYGNTNMSDFAVTPERITRAYQLFYPLETPSPETIDALNAVGLKAEDWLKERNFSITEAAKIKQSWSLILATICYSPDWQSP